MSPGELIIGYILMGAVIGFIAADWMYMDMDEAVPIAIFWPISVTFAVLVLPVALVIWLVNRNKIEKPDPTWHGVERMEGDSHDDQV